MIDLFDDITVCPLCGGELKEWHGTIYECYDCGNMMDLDEFNEEV